MMQENDLQRPRHLYHIIRPACVMDAFPWVDISLSSNRICGMSVVVCALSALLSLQEGSVP
jgi:hypothetical protein